MEIVDPSGLFPWQILALEGWQAHPDAAKPEAKVAEEKRPWTEELGREAILAAFGLSADSLADLVARFKREGREEENGDEDLADQWAFAGSFDDLG